MPEISIIIPIYNNKEKYLRKCIESLLSQTFVNFELLLINDGATDNSPSICEEYIILDKRIKLFNKKNGGISSARNRGILEANGEYICFVDHDDWVESNYLEIFMKNIQNNDLVITNFKNIHPNKIVNNSNFKESELIKEKFVPDNFDKNSRFVLIELTWNKIFKRDIIMGANIRFKENMKIGEDLIFVLEYALLCKRIIFVNIFTYNYNRLPGTSVTLNYIPNYYNKAKEIKNEIFKVKERYQEISKEEKLLHYFRVASKAIFEEGKPTNGKSFFDRYKSIKDILNIPEIVFFINNNKILYSESRFFKLIQILMKNGQVLLLTLLLTLFFKLKSA